MGNNEKKVEKYQSLIYVQPEKYTLEKYREPPL